MAGLAPTTAGHLAWLRRLGDRNDIASERARFSCRIAHLPKTDRADTDCASLWYVHLMLETPDQRSLLEKLRRAVNRRNDVEAMHGKDSKEFAIVDSKVRKLRADLKSFASGAND